MTSATIELLSDRVRNLSQFIVQQGLEVPPADPEYEKTLSNILQTTGLPDIQSTLRQSTIDSDTSTQKGSASQQFDPRPETSPNTNSSVPNTYGPRPPGPAGDIACSPLQAMQGLLELADAVESMDGTMRDCNSWNWRAAAGQIPQGSITQGGMPQAAMPPAAMSQGAMPQETMPQGGMIPPNCVPSVGDLSSPAQQPSASGGAPSCPSLEVDDGTSSTEGVDELADRLSDLLGTLHVRPGGHIRFYGATSNFSLLETPAADVGMNVHWTVRNDGIEHLRRLGLNKKVPPEIEQHLMDLYFTWQDPSFHVVDRKMFEEATRVWSENMEDTAYYSEALRNAICALGAAFDARHHPAFVTFPRSLADFFADRAKALLDIELDSPCVATIQALILLSAHDIGCARDAKGWLFSGTYIKIPCEPGRFGAFTDHVLLKSVWSFYLGQPFRLSMKGVSLAKPGSNGRLESSGQWTPYLRPGSSQGHAPLVDCAQLVCRYQVMLFEATAPLSDTLHGTTMRSKVALQESIVQAVKKLSDWQEQLPLQLRVDLEDREAIYLPHVILLHANLARKMCMDSASAIAQLLRLYEDRYTLRRINIQAVAITFSAALLLVFATVSRYQRDKGDEILSDLSVCFRALDELAPAWDSAKRARDFLTRLQRHWERETRSTFLDESASSITKTRKRSRPSFMSEDQSPLSSLRGETASSTMGSDYYRNRGVTNDFGMDLDFDWMLRTSMEVMPGNWGSIFSVPSGAFQPG
ncbi:hypothetical protein N0V82_008570 [Gnomoniopsis sp. IMI 355080]|nr:hypothetical protein N0V82_008570 [Gnomoniopsis sp. IMI 355080]